MNYYAGTLLLNCKNADSFIMMNYLLTVPVISTTFSVDMRKLGVYAEIFEELLAEQSSKLQKYLKVREYQFVTYMFDSVASLFCGNFPYSAVLKIWDAILGEPEVGIFRTGLAVFKAMEKEIMEKDLEEIMMMVKFPCVHVTEEAILKMLSKTELSSKDYYKLKEKKMAQAGIKC